METESSDTRALFWCFSFIGFGLSSILWATLRVYPKPIPGIPHNVYATQRITGDLAEVQERQNAVGSIRPWFLEQAQKHGSAIVQIFLGPFARPTILLSDYREVYDILTYREADFQRGKKVEGLKGILPHAFPSLESFDPRYKESKAIMRGLMTPSFLQNVSAPQVYLATVRLLELWQLKCHMSCGRPFDAAGDIFAFSFDAVLSVATGLADSGGDLGRQISILRAHEESRTFTIGNSSVDQPIIFPIVDPSLERKALGIDEERLWKAFYMPSPRLYHWYNSLRPAVRNAKRTMTNCISSRIQTIVLDIKKGCKPRSALGYIIQYQIKDAERTGHNLVFDDPRIRDGIYGYLIAGHDTSAGSLLWLLNRLVTHREEQGKVRNNLRETYAAAWEERRLPTVSEMSKPATYLNAFIEEYSARHNNTRVGRQIPKDTPIFLNLTGPSLSMPSIPVEECLRNPTSQARGSRRENWDDSNPTKFCPNRWLRTTPEGKVIFDASSGPTLMFSAGRKGCWGKNLGHLELRIVPTLLLWTFDLCEIPDSLGSEDIYDSLVTAPKHCFLRLSGL
ncbi:cytochrome P450 [Xylaria digitata]|nr:cytochrome P450 [Xylaria digitata]